MPALARAVAFEPRGSTLALAPNVSREEKIAAISKQRQVGLREIVTGGVVAAGSMLSVQLTARLEALPPSVRLGRLRHVYLDDYTDEVRREMRKQLTGEAG